MCAVSLLMLMPLGAPSAAASSFTVTGRVCPSDIEAPVITTPGPGMITAESLLDMAGTAYPGSAVNIIRNDILAGTAVADNDGNWLITITLFTGINHIYARSCLDSPLLDIEYRPPVIPPAPTQPPQPPVAVGDRPPTRQPPSRQRDPVPGGIAPGGALPATVPADSFFLTSDLGTVYTRLHVDTTLYADIHGGTGPYQVRFDWGDGSHTLLRQSTAGTVASKHAYAQRGLYRAQLTVTDAAGRASVFDYLVSVRGPSYAGTRVFSLPWGLLLAIALELLVVMLVFSIWEYIERRGPREQA